MTELRALLFLGMLGCGGRDVVLGDGAPDASAADAGPDAARDAAAEDAGPSPFSPPRLLPLPEGDGPDDDPSLTSDLTLLVFNSERSGGLGREDLWYAERPDEASAFSAPVPLEALNTSDRETGVALSADGLTLWFSSDRPEGLGRLDVYVTRRASRSEPFGAPSLVSEVSSVGDDLVSATSDGGRTLYLSRRDDGASAYGLFVATRPSADVPFEPPTPLTALNVEGANTDAFPFADGASLAFTRDEDLWLAQRRDGVLTPEGPVVELNGPADDRDPWLSPDGSLVIFSSNRSGAYRLYEARR